MRFNSFWGCTDTCLWSTLRVRLAKKSNCIKPPTLQYEPKLILRVITILILLLWWFPSFLEEPKGQPMLAVFCVKEIYLQKKIVKAKKKDGNFRSFRRQKTEPWIWQRPWLYARSHTESVALYGGWNMDLENVRWRHWRIFIIQHEILQKMEKNPSDVAEEEYKASKWVQCLPSEPNRAWPRRRLNSGKTCILWGSTQTRKWKGSPLPFCRFPICIRNGGAVQKAKQNKVSEKRQDSQQNVLLNLMAEQDARRKEAMNGTRNGHSTKERMVGVIEKLVSQLWHER